MTSAAEQQHGKPDPVAVAENLAAEIRKKYDDFLEQKTTPSSWASTRASGIGDPCLRRIVYWRTEGEKAQPYSKFSAAYMTTGNLYEGPVLRMLEGFGIEFEKGQMALPKIEGYDVGTKIDRAITRDGVEIIVEMKATGKYVIDKITDAESMKESSSPYIRKWYDQIITYLFFADRQVGLLILWDKERGLLKLVVVPMDYERAEYLTDRAITVSEHLKAKTLPDFIKDPAECRKCPFFGRTCDPPLDFGPGVQTIADNRLISLAHVMEVNKEAAAEHASAAKEVKEYFKAASLDGEEKKSTFLLGDFQVKTSWGRSSSAKVPKDIKDQYVVVKEKGRCTVTVEKLD